MAGFACIDDVTAAADERVGAGLEIADGFGAGGFNDVKVRGESGGVRRFAGEERLEVLRAESEEDLLFGEAADVVARGKFDFHGASAAFAEDEA